MLIGAVSSLALAGQTTAFDGRTMLSAHVAGLLGACLLLGLSLSLPHLRYSARTLRRMGDAFVVANVANTGVTAVKSFFFVHGVAPGGPAANTVIFGVLTLLVVVPTLVVSFLWATGFKGHTST